MVIGIRKIPRVLAKGKLFADFPKRLYSKAAYTNAGQNPSFRCSQTLSLTAAIGAMGIALPDHSNIKCSRDPKTTMKMIPANSQSRILFFTVITSHRSYCRIGRSIPFSPSQPQGPGCYHYSHHSYIDFHMKGSKESCL